MMSFEEIKREYEQAREQERLTLRDYLNGHKALKEAGLDVVDNWRSGKGHDKYESGGRISPFDLSNWKWVEIKDNSDFSTIVSLNPPEVDPDSKNTHCLYDRIGVQLPSGNWIYTSIDLPLSSTDKEEIAQLILNIYQEHTASN